MTKQTQKLIMDFRVLVADAEDLVKATATQTGDKIIEASGRIQQSIADLKPQLAQAEALLKERTTAEATTLDDYVYAKLVALAAGIGLLVGILIGRS